MPVLYNSLCWGSSHAPFDAALLVAARLAFPDEPAACIGTDDHLAEVARLLPPDQGRDVAWLPATIPTRHEKRTGPRLRAEWRLMGMALGEARRGGARTVIAAAGSPVMFLAAARLAIGPRRGVRVALVHHGALPGMLTSRRLRGYLLVADRCGARQVVLGDSIRRNLVARGPALRHLAAVHHPYLFGDVAPSTLGGPVRFGFLGMASRDKGFEAFCRIADAMHDTAGARFELIGAPAREFAAQLPPGAGKVAGTGDARHLTRDEYERRVAAVHYAVMPYRADHYRLVGSGSVLDALAFGKPIIALRNDLLTAVFDELGDVGLLVDDLDALHDAIAGVVREPPVERYRRQSEALLRGRDRFAPGAVAAELRAALG